MGAGGAGGLGLRIPAALRREMRAHVRSCLPEEACGLLGGSAVRRTAVRVLAVENLLHSPARFQMRPEAQVRALFELERAGLDLLAIYHSHPTGPGWPSARDAAEFAYPGVLVCLWYPRGAGWDMKLFDLSGGLVREIENLSP